VLLFDPDGAEAHELLPVLESQLANGYTAYALNAPFEHLVIEVRTEPAGGAAGHTSVPRTRRGVAQASQAVGGPLAV
jgi:hypothetical protein